jgi:hypothetical protein
LLLAAEHQRACLVRDFERSEQPEVEHAAFLTPRGGVSHRLLVAR